MNIGSHFDHFIVQTADSREQLEEADQQVAFSQSAIDRAHHN